MGFLFRWDLGTPSQRFHGVLMDQSPTLQPMVIQHLLVQPTLEHALKNHTFLKLLRHFSSKAYLYAYIQHWKQHTNVARQFY